MREESREEFGRWIGCTERRKEKICWWVQFVCANTECMWMGWQKRLGEMPERFLSQRHHSVLLATSVRQAAFLLRVVYPWVLQCLYSSHLHSAFELHGTVEDWYCGVGQLCSVGSCAVVTVSLGFSWTHPCWAVQETAHGQDCLSLPVTGMQYGAYRVLWKPQKEYHIFCVRVSLLLLSPGPPLCLSHWSMYPFKWAFILHGHQASACISGSCKGCWRSECCFWLLSSLFPLKALSPLF